MPLNVLGPSANAASATSVGSELAGRREVEVDAVDAAAAAGDGERAAAADDLVAPMSGRMLGEHRAGLRRVRRPAGDRRRVPPAIMAAARNGAALERSGSIATSLPRIGAGRDDPLAGRGRSTCTPRCASASIVMSMCGMLGSRSPAWTQVQADVEARRREQQARDELARRARVDRRPRRRATCPCRAR